MFYNTYIHIMCTSVCVEQATNNFDGRNVLLPPPHRQKEWVQVFVFVVIVV